MAVQTPAVIAVLNTTQDFIRGLLAEQGNTEDVLERIQQQLGAITGINLDAQERLE